MRGAQLLGQGHVDRSAGSAGDNTDRFVSGDALNELVVRYGKGGGAGGPPFESWSNLFERGQIDDGAMIIWYEEWKL